MSTRPQNEIKAMARRHANEIITLLRDRGGFKGWWHDIEPDTQEEIIEEIAGQFSQAIEEE